MQTTYRTLIQISCSDLCQENPTLTQIHIDTASGCILQCCYIDPVSFMSYGNWLAFLHLPLRGAPYCLMFAQIYCNCQCTYRLMLFMYAILS